MPSNLSPLAQARHTQAAELASLYVSMGENLTRDLANPENKTESALTGLEWETFCQIVARFAIIINRATVTTVNTKAPE